ncbi:nudix hydrolase 18, mitochondrial-like [Andrographis paniculata]|uniref:nudix hydrolase 18, mitochondrial-like n=1 Tax=Andrographis paniculata TaxID=175694 RepID=UPI0021E9724D|nr:nudix hydrolase 18, mitochondrial-like [Andrographis paniculata]
MELKNMIALVSRTGRHMQRYNFLGHRQVVGCIPYRYKCGNGTPHISDEDEIEVLVITSQRKGKGMLFPKGGWEKDESMEDAALRETVEEAGVVGDVEHKLGDWTFSGKNNDMWCESHMFPLLVKEQLELWPEKNSRQRIWVSVREARKVCQYWWMKEALELLVKRLTMQIKVQGGSEAETGSLSQKGRKKSNL